MRDDDYVRRLLTTDYETHKHNEYPYPILKHIISHTDFDFVSGDVVNQRNNGKPNRDGEFYQFFPFGNKRILVHRFMVAVALRKWPPRELEVHHLNANPSDNRPLNLELVTSRDNNAARRVPLRNIVDLSTASTWAASIAKIGKRKHLTRKRSDSYLGSGLIKLAP